MAVNYCGKKFYIIDTGCLKDFSGAKLNSGQAAATAGYLIGLFG
jgi:hypothetical protein